MFILKPLLSLMASKYVAWGIAAGLPLLQPRRSFLYGVRHGLE
jgi:hypothetical protein